LASSSEAGQELFRTLHGCTDDQKKLVDSTNNQFEGVWQRVHNIFKERQAVLGEVIDARFAAESRNGHENLSAFKDICIYQFRTCGVARPLPCKGAV